MTRKGKTKMSQTIALYVRPENYIRALENVASMWVAPRYAPIGVVSAAIIYSAVVDCFARDVTSREVAS